MTLEIGSTKVGLNSSGDHLERLWPTPATLDAVLLEFPDHRQRYEFALDYLAGKTVADIACGAGYGTFLMSKVARSVTGYDISEDALSHARRHFHATNVSFENAANLSVKHFDVVVSFETIEHMTEQDGDIFLKRLNAALAGSDGILIISTPINRTGRRVNVTPFHLREYNEEEFSQKLASNGFEVMRWFGQCNAVSEKLAAAAATGLSVNQIISTGLHRMIPKVIRRAILKAVLGKRLQRVNTSFRIVPDDLSSAAVQIAVCRRR